jgi:hypothetical protein
MYKEILRGIGGIGIFPVVSLLLFVMVFALVVLRALRMDRAGIQHLAGLPLEDSGGEAGTLQGGGR